jgi:hypothetical protein
MQVLILNVSSGWLHYEGTMMCLGDDESLVLHRLPSKLQSRAKRL